MQQIKQNTMIKTILSLSLSICSLSAAAKPDVKGMVLDANGEPLPMANVVLLTAGDSAFVTGSTSGLDGKFNIPSTATGGILRISQVGYETQHINISSSNMANIIVNMKEDAKVLNEVTVKGQLPKTKLTGNSMVTTIEGTVLGHSGTAEEMLGKVPGMTRKGENLEVLGKGEPVYYINGRKMTDKDELKRLRSEEIRDVEVITNPGAAYDATVTAVVRIKTLRQQGDGFGFDVSANNNQDLAYGYSDPNATVNLKYRHNNIDFFGMVNYWKWDSVNDSHPDQSSYLMNKGQIINIQQSTDLRHDWRGQGMNYNAGFNWQISNDHSLGMRIERHDKFKSGINAWIENDINTRYHGSSTPYETQYSRSVQDDKQTQPYNWDGNLYYNGKVGKLGIDFNADFVATKNSEKNSICEMSGENRENTTASQMSQAQHTKSDMWATKLVLSYPIWKGQLQAGTEMSFVNRDNDYMIAGYPLPTTDSHVDEQNVAGFVEYAFSTPQIGNVSAGVRYEHVGFDFTDRISADNNMSRYTNDFFPSLSWSKQFGNWQTALSYSFRTIRPNFSMLDESIMYINPYSLQQGDPKLKNATMQEVSANVRWSWLSMFMAYERRDNALTQWSYIYNDDGVILIKNINLDVPMRNLAIFLMASPTFGCWNPNYTVGWQKFFVTEHLADPREASGERKVRFTKPIMFFDINNTFRFKHSWQFEANLNMMLKGDVMNYHLSSNSYNLTFVAQKCWLKNDALCLRVSMQDVLQRSTQKIQMDCGYYTLDQLSKRNNHRLNVSLRYSFNASQNKYKGTGAGKAVQERMSND